MNSLRGRLIVSYAIVVAVVLALVSLLACRIAFEFLARTTLDTLALSVARAEDVATGKTGVRPDAALARAIAAASAPGVVVFAPERDGPPPGGRPPNFAGPPGDAGGPPRGDFGHGPPARPPPDGFEFNPHGHVVADSALVRTVIGPFLGLYERSVNVRGAKVVIGPDYYALEPLLRSFMWLLAGSLAVSTILAWTIAAWLANQAVLPLITLTRELERFSAGDFATRPVTTSERGELGALIAAYNGAAAQVSSAFHERLEVELHMRRFLADAGHELRTPLTVIGGYLEILRKGGIDDPTIRQRAIATLTDEARRMRTLIDRLLTLARLERPDVSEHTEVNLSALAGAAVDHVRAARGGDISLLCPHPVFVLADPAELSEAIENVVDNAIKYGRNSAVVVRIETSDDAAIVRIRDGGGGIPAAERGRLFERFFRGDERGEIEGTGLGLAIAQRAVARCGGRIKLEDGAPGRTTFAITLPTATRRAISIEPLRI